MTWQTIKLLGFAPDAPTNTPGIFTDSSAIIPTERGFANGGIATTAATGTMAGRALGGAVLTLVDGRRRIVAGTATKLYEIYGGQVTDRSAYAYSASPASAWSFAQFGNVTLAVNKQNKLQASLAGDPTGVGYRPFEEVAAAPKAGIVIAPSLPAGQWAMLFDYNDGTNDYADGIFWSKLSDFTDWTPSIADQCGNVRITDVGGPWFAAAPYRDSVVAWKRNAMYLGVYIGGDFMWGWQRIASGIGIFGKNAWTVLNDAIYFADENGLWIYDGGYPRPMPGAVQRYWRTAVSVAGVVPHDQQVFCRLVADPARQLIWAGVGLQGTQKDWIVYSAARGTWTRYKTFTVADDFFSSEYAAEFSTTPGIRGIAWGAGSSPQADMTLGALGDESAKTTLTALRPVWITGPSDVASISAWCSLSVDRKNSLRNLSPTFTVAGVYAPPGRFDLTVSDQYLRPRLSVNGNTDFEIAEIEVNLVPGGAA